MRIQLGLESRKSLTDMSKKNVRRIWTSLCGNCKHRIAFSSTGGVSIHKEQNPKLRETCITWFTGSFLGNPADLKRQLRKAVYRCTESRIESEMKVQTWNGPVLTRIKDSTRKLLKAIGDIPSKKARAKERGKKKKKDVGDVGQAQKL